jgi:hypothetical protein
MRIQIDENWMVLHAETMADASELVGASQSEFIPPGTYLKQNGIGKISLNFPISLLKTKEAKEKKASS